MRHLALPRSKPARRITVIAVVILLTAGTGIGVAVATRDVGPKTPCQASVETVDLFRDADPAVTAEMTGEYSLMLRRIAVGDYTDIEGEVPLVLDRLLRTVADDLDSGKLTAQQTGQDIDALLDYCDTE